MSDRDVRLPVVGDGWALVSAEERHAAHPATFLIPTREARASLRPGDAAKLLFDIEIRGNGRIIDRGVDRMWVIVVSRAGDLYRGLLDNDPGRAEGLSLHLGAEVVFGPEHVAEIDHPPRGYIIDKYGASLLED
jgi:hypothetical protein